MNLLQFLELRTLFAHYRFKDAHGGSVVIEEAWDNTEKDAPICRELEPDPVIFAHQPQ